MGTAAQGLQGSEAACQGGRGSGVPAHKEGGAIAQGSIKVPAWHRVNTLSGKGLLKSETA